MSPPKKEEMAVQFAGIPSAFPSYSPLLRLHRQHIRSLRCNFRDWSGRYLGDAMKSFRTNTLSHGQAHNNNAVSQLAWVTIACVALSVGIAFGVRAIMVQHTIARYRALGGHVVFDESSPAAYLQGFIEERFKMKHVSMLEPFCRVSEIELQGTSAMQSDLETLYLFPEMETLNISHTNVRGIAFGELSKCGNLKVLYANDIRIDGNSSVLNHMPALESLLLANAGLTDDDMRHIGGCRNLKNISLVGNRISSSGVALLRGNMRLENIGLAYTDVDSQVFTILASLPALQVLHLGGTRITKLEFPEGVALERLEYIDLSKSRITSIDHSVWTSMPAISGFRIDNCDISADQLCGIGNASSLEFLSIDDNQINSAFIDTLRSMPRLRRIEVWSAKPSNGELKESWGDALTKGLPEVSIELMRHPEQEADLPRPVQ